MSLKQILPFLQQLLVYSFHWEMGMKAAGIRRAICLKSVSSSCFPKPQSHEPLCTKQEVVSGYSSHKSVGQVSGLTSAGQSLWIHPSCAGALSSSGLLCSVISSPSHCSPASALSFWGPSGMNLMLNGISEEQSCFLSPAAWWERGNPFLITHLCVFQDPLVVGAGWGGSSLHSEELWGKRNKNQKNAQGWERPSCLQLKAMAVMPLWERSGQCWQVEGTTGGLGH